MAHPTKHGLHGWGDGADALISDKARMEQRRAELQAEWAELAARVQADPAMGRSLGERIGTLSGEFARLADQIARKQDEIDRMTAVSAERVN